MNDNETKTTDTTPVSPPVPGQTSQDPPKTPWYTVGGIIVLLFAVGLFTLLQKSKTPPGPTKTVQQNALSPKPTLSRSKAPKIITNVITASALNAQGKATAAVTSFAKTDKNIYLILTLNQPKAGTKIEYIRYLNSKYLDHGTTTLSKANLTNASFVWSLKKPGAIHLAGTYKVKAYTNGIFEKETLYTVR